MACSHPAGRLAPGLGSLSCRGRPDSPVAGDRAGRVPDQLHLGPSNGLGTPGRQTGGFVPPVLTRLSPLAIAMAGSKLRHAARPPSTPHAARLWQGLTRLPSPGEWFL